MRRLLRISILFLGLLCWRDAANAADVGFVLEMRGKWLLEGAKPVSILIGQAVPSSGKIRPADLSGLPKITVVLLDGKTIARDCSVKEQCSGPIDLPAALQPESSVWSRLVTAVSSVFKHDPARYQPMIARSTQGLSDCVLELRNGSADLAPAFDKMKASTYEVVFRSLETASESNRVTYSWNPAAPAAASLPGIKPGLYRMSLAAASGSSEAWCLLAQPQNFSRLDSDFRQATAITESWNAPAGSPAVKSFLRACLQHLQESAL